MRESDVHTRPTMSDDLVADPRPAASTHPRLIDTRTWLLERVDGRVAAAVALAWFVLTQIIVALEPAAQFELPLISVVLTLSMYSLLVMMAAGLVMRRRWGLLAAVASSLLLTAEAIACPLTGHHHFGAWWYGQMACALALVGITVFALRRDYSEFNAE
jgi:hypothetical protein